MPRLTAIRGFLPYALVVFLNAFVDLGHKIVIQNTVFKIYDGQTQIILTAVVNALILIPFILLFSPSGFLSDKYPKHKVMQYSAWAAVVATVLITASYYAGLFWVAFLLTLGLAIQSALYSPAKYGFIKELVGNEKLARANGVIQATTISGILLGTFVFSALFEGLLGDFVASSPSELLSYIAPIGWILVVLSIIELILAYRLPEKTQTDHSRKFLLPKYFKLEYLKTNINAIQSKPVIWLSIIGLSTFWAISQVMLAAFPAFAKDTLGETNTLIIQGILACSGLGIIAGSIIAGRVSRSHIELGLIPLGALGVAISIAVVPNLDSALSMGVAFFGLGALGGIFIIPLNALIQYHSDEKELGTMLAGNNWFQNVSMLSFLILTVVFASIGLDSRGLFALLVIVAIIGTGYTLKKLPQSFVRIVVSVLFRRRYNITVTGFKNLPATGPVLLLGNHISWIDWALIQIACPRPIRFVMLRQIYNQWYLKPVLKFFGVIPIAKGQSAESLASINEELKQGQVVCLFPEGAISRNGQLGKFHSGFERTVEGIDTGVIVPFYLRGLWGSSFSRSSEKLRESRAPGFRRDLIVAFGKSLPISTKADEVKQKVFELSIDAWMEYSQSLDPIPLAWLKTARSQMSDIAVVESRKTLYTNRQIVAAVLAVAHKLKHIHQPARIGILLSPSVHGLVGNLAALLRGHTVVNINSRSSGESIQTSLEQTDVDCLITDQATLDSVTQHQPSDTFKPDTPLVLVNEALTSMTPLRRMINQAVSYLPANWIYFLKGRTRMLDEAAAILFTSGTQSTPKPVVLSHRNIMANCKQVSDVLNTNDDDVLIGSLPLSNAFGFTVTAIMPLIEGLPIVCQPDYTDPEAIAKAIARHRVTVFCATADQIQGMHTHDEVLPLMLEPLRVVVSGAAKLNIVERSAFEHKFNKVIYEGYGATETSPVASSNIPDVLDTTYWSLQHGNRPGSVGLPLPGTCFRIVDSDTFAPLPLESQGLVLISGPQIMLGYDNDPEQSATRLLNMDDRRWYNTGDIGTLSREGFLTINDRE